MISGWQDCPRRSAAKAFQKHFEELGYVFREQSTQIYSVVGTAVHAGASHTLKEKMIDNIIPVKEAIEISIENYKENTIDGVEFDNITDSNNTAQKQIINIQNTYHTQIVPFTKPVAVEFAMEVEAPGGILVTGHPDLLEMENVVDTKTGKSGENHHGQLGCYSLLAKAKQIAFPKKGRIDWIPRTSLKKPPADAVQFEYDIDICEAEAKSTLTDIARQWAKFKESQNIFVFPTNTKSMLCGPKYCIGYGTDLCPISKTFRR